MLRRKIIVAVVGCFLIVQTTKVYARGVLCTCASSIRATGGRLMPVPR